MTKDYMVWIPQLRNTYKVYGMDFSDEGGIKSYKVRLKDDKPGTYHLYTPEDAILLEDTGLVDKYGHKIYSDDMIYFTRGQKGGQNYHVFWDNGWRIMGLTQSETEFWGHNKATSFVRIGSKFQVAELYRKYCEQFNVN